MRGYIDSDGYFDGTLYKTSSVSRELCFGIAQCVAKVYHRPFSIYRTSRPSTTVIENRTVNQKDSYTVTWKVTCDEQDKAFYEDGYIWYPLSKLPIFQEDSVEVFNMSVEEDESYTANGAIVHNCTDISVAGRQQGFAKGSGTRSSLLWECERAIQIKKPKYLLMENVKALVHEKNRKLFKEWLFFLDKLGYENFLPPEFPTPWKGRGAHTALYTINAADMGVPQNRERVFLVSILRTEEDQNPKYYFPEPFPLTKKLKDVLEEHVDEKYYLSDKMLEYFQSVNDDDSHGHDFNPKTEDDDTAFTLRTKPGQRVDDNFFME